MSKEEFQKNFSSFMGFIENPEEGADFLDFEKKGELVASNRLYEMALKYPWLRFMVDNRITIMGDLVLIGGYLTIKANRVFQKYTGLSLKEKVAVWLRSKKIIAEKKQNKHKGLGFLGLVAREKRLKPEKSQASSKE